MKQRPHPSTKPYFECFSCPDFRQSCSGKSTRDMTLRELFEFICDVMDYFHLTISYVAEKADVSVKTVEKIRALNCEQDMMRGTMQRVEQVVFGSFGNHICHRKHSNNTSVERIDNLLSEVAQIINKYLDH